MLIGFSGASGSGKTTLVNALARTLKSQGYDVGIVQEVVRKTFIGWQHKYASLNELRQSDEITRFQIEILLNQWEAEVRALKNHQIVLTDRTIYDNLFFTLLWHNKDFQNLDRYLKIFQHIESVKRTGGIEGEMEDREYDIIFLCPPLHHVDVNDGFRTYDDIHYRSMQFAGLKILIPDRIRKSTVPVYDMGNKEEEIKLRVQHCLDELKFSALYKRI